jgi:hypothetical protein
MDLARHIAEYVPEPWETCVHDLIEVMIVSGQYDAFNGRIFVQGGYIYEKDPYGLWKSRGPVVTDEDFDYDPPCYSREKHNWKEEGF